MPVNIFNGTAFVQAAPQIYNGSSWVTPSNGYAFDGSTWVPFWASLQFDPPVGSYSDFRFYPNTARFTISATQIVKWTYTFSGDHTTMSIPSGSTSTDITMTLQSVSTRNKTSTINITATYNNVNYFWTITLTTEGLQ